MLCDKISAILKKYGICQICRMSNGKEIDYDSAKIIMSKDQECILLDVRSPQEYREKSLDNSINIPIYEIKKKINNVVIDKQTNIILYCQTGNRSIRAISILSKMGYENLYSIKGGLDNIVTQ